MSDELGSWVVALYTPPGSRPVHKFRLKAWAGFLRERGCLVVVPAEDLRRKATHVLLVDPPPCDDADADNRFGTYLGSMPASCVAGTSGAPPKILRQEWIYDSIREKRPMPTDAYEVTARNPGQSMTRTPLTAVQPRAPAPVTCHNPPPPPKPSPDVQEILRAINDAKNDACLDACQPSNRDETSVDVGTLSGCLAAECAAAARSLDANPPASDLLTRTAFQAFRREGYPGFVGRTNVVEDVVEAALGHEWDSREKNALAAEDARWLRRRASRSDVTLLDLPDGVLGEVMERLCMRDALNAGAACRRLFRVAFGELNKTTNEDRSLYRPRVCPAWPDRTGGVGTTRCVRVMTWNLKNNDPNPACRFMNQPGAGAEDGGWHWYSRLPIVARAIQRDKPGVVCLQEDLGCMAVELMCAREMRAASSTGDDLGTTRVEYKCYPPPVRNIEDACAAAKSRRVLLSPSDVDPTCDPDDVDVLIADSLYTRSRWEQNSVWWRDDTYEAVDAGQFEWLDGRTRARFRGSVTQSNVNKSEMLAGSCIAFTWVLLRLKGDEHGGFGRVNRAWNDKRSGSRKFSSLDRRICVCSTHLEAGHDQNKDVPAKRNSAVCVRAAVRRLQARHGPTVPVIVAGDFNMQKIQQHYRLLTGEGAGISRGLKNVTSVSPSRDFASRVPEGKGGDGGTNASTPTPPAGKKRTEREWDLAETNTDRACELVDVFDMLDRDNPDTKFDPKYLGVRSGGHNGTTWHGWKGPRHAEMISHTIATHCKHNAQLGFWDPSERADGNGGGGGNGGGYRPPKKGRRDDFSMLSDFSGVGGGFSGQIGGVGRKTQKIGAVGHQRHIDHVFVAKGDGVRDDGRMDKQCRARCVRAFVRTDTSSENFRLPGESRCACGAFNAARYLSPAVRTGGVSRCTCDDVDGVWASDHFPVVADLRLSWAVGEGEPSSRELDSNGRRPNTP